MVQVSPEITSPDPSIPGQPLDQTPRISESVPPVLKTANSLIFVQNINEKEKVLIPTIEETSDEYDTVSSSTESSEESQAPEGNLE